jgi:hypothetical protein
MDKNILVMISSTKLRTLISEPNTNTILVTIPAGRTKDMDINWTFILLRKVKNPILSISFLPKGKV